MSEDFADFLSRVSGVRTIRSSHMTRDDAAPNRFLLPLAPNAPHSEDPISVQDELATHVSCDHPLIKDNNDEVCCYLEEYTRRTQCAASIKLHQKKKSGRDYWSYLVWKCARNEKSEQEIK